MSVVHVYGPRATRHHERMLKADEKRLACRQRAWRREDELSGIRPARRRTARRLARGRRRDAWQHLIVASIGAAMVVVLVAMTTK